MVSLQEQETLQLRALKLLTPIKGTFPLYTLPSTGRLHARIDAFKQFMTAAFSTNYSVSKSSCKF